MNDPNRLTADLIIPALNEQDNIPALLAAVPSARLRHILVVDNGSTDRTAELARSGGAVVVQEVRRGYGSACLAGLAWIASNGPPPDAVAFVDADLADDPTILPRMFETMGQKDIDLMIGSRRKLAGPGSLTVSQCVGNFIACRSLRLLTGQQYSDLGPMRVIRWESLQRLNMSDRTWGWTVEMQYKAAAQSMRILEVDVPYRARQAGTSKISGSIIGSVRAGYKILATLAKLWWCYHVDGHHPRSR